MVIDHMDMTEQDIVGPLQTQCILFIILTIICSLLLTLSILVLLKFTVLISILHSMYQNELLVKSSLDLRMKQ